MKNVILLFSVALALIAVVAMAFFRYSASAATPTVSVTSWPDDANGQQIEFWNLIEKTRSDADRQLQLSKLRKELESLQTSDLESFIRVFDKLMHETYSWDLWGATFVVHGGASDDAFEDFRKWLISNGKELFEQAKSNPDNLATLIPNGRTEEATFEEFSYVAIELWMDRTGKQAAELPKEKDSLYPNEPFGEPFSEEPEDLEKRYPQLWQRFGESPLN